MIEGAAGAGKTTTLAATKAALSGQGRQMMVVTPTLKAADVAAAEIDAPAFSAAWLVHQWGRRWDDDGHWACTRELPTNPMAKLSRGGLLVVDEAGMLDQDTARALLEIAQECQARVAFMGDRHQLPAVGRGGVLDLATQHTSPEATMSLDVAHRFADPTYADLSVAMRRGEPDRVATRRNDWHLGLANRQTWTITALADETLSLRNDHGLRRQVPTWYAQAWAEAAYATTVYGAQGETTAVGHLVMDQGITAASAYVG